MEDKREQDDMDRRLRLINARLDGPLSPAEASGIERLVLADPDARRDVEAFDRLAALALRARVEAPPGFADRVLAGIRGSGPESRPRTDFGRQAGILDRLRLILSPPARRPALAGALAVLALVLLLGRVAQRPMAPLPGGESPDPAAGMTSHRFELFAPDARRVCLVGDFNNWKVCEAPLVRDPRTGAWKVQMDLPPGRYEYMFVVDDQEWVTDPEAEIHVEDGFGNENAVVFI